MRLRKVVVGTDFTEAANAAARWIARHLAPDAELILVHAVELTQPPSFLRSLLPASEETAESLRFVATEHLRELAALLEPVQVRIEARIGSAADVLLELARAHEADLIVVGGHGSRRGVLGLIGTTTERLVSSATVPVLVARGLSDTPLRSVLAPIDPSYTATQVLEWGRVFSRQFGARVTVAYVVDVLQAYSRIRTVSAATRLAEMEGELRSRSRNWISERLREAGYEDDEAEISVMVGDPRSAIPVLAERAEADLIVMGSRGAGTVGRAVLGSVASGILSTTSYAVLIVMTRTQRRSS